jgi:hypothetical protein
MANKGATLLEQAYNEGFAYGRSASAAKIVVPEAPVNDDEADDSAKTYGSMLKFQQKYVKQWMKGYEAGLMLVVCGNEPTDLEAPEEEAEEETEEY